MVDEALDSLPNNVALSAKYIRSQSKVTVNDLEYGSHKDIVLKCTYETIDVHTTIKDNANDLLSSISINDPKTGKPKNATKVQIEVAQKVQALLEDAPALTGADVGIAIGAGTDVAIDAADIVLMKSTLADVPAAIRISRATLKNIKENLFWAFFYNSIGIPLAAGAFIAFLGWEMNPMFGAAAMSLSSFCVVSNALRLNLFDPYSTKKDRKVHGRIKPKTASETQKITVSIEGMMCCHCEASVCEALSSIPGIEIISVSHEAKCAIVIAPVSVKDKTLKKVIVDKDYKVTSITRERA
jgi:copper chaperone CopZ